MTLLLPLGLHQVSFALEDDHKLPKNNDDNSVQNNVRQTLHTV